MLTRRAREEAQRQLDEREQFLPPDVIDLDINNDEIDAADLNDDELIFNVPLNLPLQREPEEEQPFQHQQPFQQEQPFQQQQPIAQQFPDMDTIKPPIFHGYGTEDGRSWLQKFDNYAALRRIQDAEKPLHFKMFLDGPAFVWAGTLANDADWAQLRESFATRFINDPTLQYCFRQEFDSRMQGTHESVELYVNDIRRLGAKLNKPDGELRDKLMRGLLPVYRAFVLSQQPATANEVEEKAKIAELVEQTKAPQTQPAPQVVNAVSYDRDGIKELTALIRKHGEQQAALQ